MTGRMLQNKKYAKWLPIVLSLIIFVQAIIIGELLSKKDDKKYEVNLVKIKTEKDSVDYQKIKDDLSLLDRTLHDINSFLRAKNITDENIETLSADSLSNAVYVANKSFRYSQYLVDLQKKLQEVPLGIPTDGYISSNYGIRKNPIRPKVQLASVRPARQELNKTEYIEEKDSLGNVIKKTLVKSATTSLAEQAPEYDQMQFHKGVDIAVAFGSNVHAAAGGTVIFAGRKGGYGHCVIISHGNGLATLYGHLSEILVNPNDIIKTGDVIAKSGNSGRSTGPHLHYEVHKNNTPVNPKLFMAF